MHVTYFCNIKTANVTKAEIISFFLVMISNFYKFSVGFSKCFFQLNITDNICFSFIILRFPLVSFPSELFF